MWAWPDLSGVADADLAVLLGGVAELWGIAFVIRVILQVLRGVR